jgi:hypothetical protein
MRPRPIAELLDAVAKMGFRPPDAFLDAAAGRLAGIGLAAVAHADLAMACGALAVFGYTPSDEWLQARGRGGRDGECICVSLCVCVRVCGGGGGHGPGRHFLGGGQ